MRKMFFRLSGAVLAVALVSGQASAQTWSGPFAPSNTGSEFWNQWSDDNTNTSMICNIGAVLTLGAPTTGVSSCSHQVAAPFLPAVQMPLATSFLTTGGGTSARFQFASGIWYIASIGRITGAGTVFPARDITFYDAINNSVLAINPTTSVLNAVNGFYIGINAYNPAGVDFYSNGAGPQQFALFAPDGVQNTVNNAGVATVQYGVNTTYYVGVEDAACTSTQRPQGCVGFNSDYDYNDAIFRVSTVPEPSTYALMATGLLGIFGMARRKRRAA